MDTEVFDNRPAYQHKKDRLSQHIRERSQQTPLCLTLKKTTSNLFRFRHKKHYPIDVRHFNQVITIDRERGLAEVEGMTTYEDLVSATLEYECLPTVVPELKTITIGGALSGIGIESSSFRYGLVHETISQFDVLLPDGRVLDCRPDNAQSDLFYAFPNSYGTLGYALKVTVKLVSVKRYVKLKFHHFHHAHDFFSTLQSACFDNRQNGPLAFIDGVIFSADHQVLVTAEMVDEVPYTNNYKYRHIYYRAVETKHEDYLTIADYIWRWDADWFWCSKAFYMQNLALRLLLGKWALKSKVYSKILRFIKHNVIARYCLKNYWAAREWIIQDVAVPISRALDYWEFFQDSISIVPIWICPIHPYHPANTYDFFKMKTNQLYVNFGFWSAVPAHAEPGFYNRLIERKVSTWAGNKSLYSDVYYSESEFWDIYDKDYYECLKEKYDPRGLLNSLYNKCIEKA